MIDDFGATAGPFKRDEKPVFEKIQCRLCLLYKPAKKVHFNREAELLLCGKCARNQLGLIYEPHKIVHFPKCLVCSKVFRKVFKQRFDDITDMEKLKILRIDERLKNPRFLLKHLRKNIIGEFVSINKDESINVLFRPSKVAAVIGRANLGAYGLVKKIAFDRCDHCKELKKGSMEFKNE